MRYQICVSGGASRSVAKQSHKLAYEVGKKIAQAGQSLVTGATVGVPQQAALGFKSVASPAGIVAGFSPAASLKDHVLTYNLPTKEFDYIHFTGMAYIGRDVQLVRSSDAVVIIGGRMGSLHELLTALDSRKVCGVLLGSGGLTEYLPKLLENIDSPHAANVIFESEPVVLIDKIMHRLNQQYAEIQTELN